MARTPIDQAIATAKESGWIWTPGLHGSHLFQSLDDGNTLLVRTLGGGRIRDAQITDTGHVVVAANHADKLTRVLERLRAG